MGGVSTFNQDIADKICARLATGETLRAICRDDGFPPESTVRGWVIDDQGGFSAQYTRARDLGLDAMADELLEIADKTEDGVTITTKEWGEEVKQGDMLGHRQLRYDARKWYLSKLAPKRYGDRLDVAVSGDVSFGDRLAAARAAKPAEPE